MERLGALLQSTSVEPESLAFRRGSLNPPDVFATGNGVDWSPDGRSIAFTMTPDESGRHGLALLSLETGRVNRLTLPPAGSAADRLPRFSPDGRTVAFFRTGIGGGGNGHLYTVAVAGGPEREVTSGRPAMQGHDWTADGKELVFSSNRNGYWGLWRIEADTSGSDPRPVVGIASGAEYPSIARKSNRLAYYDERGDQDIWRVPASLGEDGSTPSIATTPFQVQASTRIDTAPQVSRDGKRIVFVSQRSGEQGVWVSDIDGCRRSCKTA